ncbi:hypothetical protein lerEdw1_013287, partial [Lerista edwardsae]
MPWLPQLVITLCLCTIDSVFGGLLTSVELLEAMCFLAGSPGAAYRFFVFSDMYDLFQQFFTQFVGKVVKVRSYQESGAGFSFWSTSFADVNQPQATGLCGPDLQHPILSLSDPDSFQEQPSDMFPSLFSAYGLVELTALLCRANPVVMKGLERWWH